ncbi:hypothetical protein JW916_12075 [Candidatus Sumerlaeota bacterium]|nr:hypothetical protein [Candidatus Sumerlaeota bacterium]
MTVIEHTRPDSCRPFRGFEKCASTSSRLRLGAEIVLLFLAALWLVGCFTGDRISWSADGRSMAFIGPDDKALWVHDTHAGESRRLTGTGTKVEGEIMCVRFLPAGTRLLFGENIKEDGGDSVRLRSVDVLNPGEFRDVVAKTEWPSFDVSSDGRKVYAIEEEKDKPPRLSEIDLASGDRTTVFSSLPAGEGFLSVDPSDKRFLLSAEEQLILLDRDSATTRLLLSNRKKGDGESEEDFWWPKWVDEAEFLFVQPENEDGEGSLVACSLDGPTTRLLCPNVYVFSPISLSADRRSVAVTTYAREQERFQAAVVGVENGDVRIETDEPFNVWFGGLDPAGKRLGFVTGREDDLEDGVVRILDLRSGKKRAVWRNEEERLFAAAEDFAADGDAVQSLAFCRDFLDRFPESRLKDSVRYRMFRLFTEEPLLDLDRAYGVLEEVGTSRLDTEKYLEAEVVRSLWPEACRVASDPAGDAITTHSTEAARAEFKFDTDRTRDLRGVWARAGKKRLYVRIDYGSKGDLTGLTFQDTLLVFSRVLSDGSATSGSLCRISDGVDWDRPIERSVLVRHWYPADKDSQYDVEIRDATDQIVSRFLVSGFAPPGNALFDIPISIQNENDEGAVVYSISRDALGLADGRDAAIQVCTSKGGIESLRALERPRETAAASGGRPFCDVADTFGAENTRERIERDVREAAGPGTRIVIRGAAGTFSNLSR